MTNIFIGVFIAGGLVAFYFNNKKRVDRTAKGIRKCVDKINPD